MREKKRYFLSFSEGDSTVESSYVIMAIAQNVEIAKKMLVDYLVEKKLPNFTYHTAKRIVREKILYKLSLRDIHFVPKEENAADKKVRKAAEWKAIKEKIKNTSLEIELVEKLFYEVTVIS